MSQSCSADPVHWRAHAGPCSSDVFHGSSTGFELELQFKLESVQISVLVFERLRRLHLVVEANCECGVALDVFKRQQVACRRSGRLRTRAVTPKGTISGVCREAGAAVRCNAMLKDMNVTVWDNDERCWHQDCHIQEPGGCRHDSIECLDFVWQDVHQRIG